LNPIRHLRRALVVIRLRSGISQGEEGDRDRRPLSWSAPHSCDPAPARRRPPQGRLGAARSCLDRHHPRYLLSRAAVNAGGSGGEDRRGT